MCSPTARLLSLVQLLFESFVQVFIVVVVCYQVLNDHCGKLKVYFARTDGWAPLAYKDSLKAAKPEIDVTVLGEQFYHAFVLDNPKEMAEIIADEIKKEGVNDKKK